MNAPTKQYFGSDGIRGKVGSCPMTENCLYALGVSVAETLHRKGLSNGKILLAKDTRASGEMVESALAEGIRSTGVEVVLAGLLPSPAVGWLTKTDGYMAGLAITASHNPPEDNGVKFFLTDASKIGDEMELEIESNLKLEPKSKACNPGKITQITGLSERFRDFCQATVPHDLDLTGLDIALDCAHGAAYQIAPELFTALGAKVTCLGVEPNGYNINTDCGSTNTAKLIERVENSGADLGLALDGDADRIVMVDRQGVLLNGDDLLFILARDRHANQCLKGGVVGTVMTNTGLIEALSAMAIPFGATEVGDAHVQARLRQEGWLLGGESSGHIFCLEHSPVADGIIAGLQVIIAWLRSQLSLKNLRSQWQPWSQRLTNLAYQPAVKRSIIDSRVAQLNENMKDITAELKGDGRLLVRTSGTEAVIRILIEARTEALMNSHLSPILDKIQNDLGDLLVSTEAQA